ncbi:hypothetical protein [Paenibacillus sp. YYML68]|uniref:hypothetical protein n=1 Tax=Paenibacillus sp. YYML68 TaxID=2909250 RepID=UPI0024938F4B|nr:hypothetical protein [Paenibacillus sp. YYML68]
MSKLKMLGYALLCGGLLFLFSIITELYKFIFSLLALYLGIRFLKATDSRGMKIAFFASAIGFYFVYTFFYAVYLYLQEHPFPTS